MKTREAIQALNAATSLDQRADVYTAHASPKVLLKGLSLAKTQDERWLILFSSAYGTTMEGAAIGAITQFATDEKELERLEEYRRSPDRMAQIRNRMNRRRAHQLEL